jgi:MTH538 TIR-like domain (DUF1863)
MARKCFISFKTEDANYKKAIQDQLHIDMVDKSLDVAINSTDEDYVMQKIRSDNLADSSVTIHLIGTKSAEWLGAWEQRFIKRELQASLFDGQNNRRNGILGVVLPSVYGTVYQGSVVCNTCGNTISVVNVGPATTVSEFYYNYYIPHGKCHHNEDDRYCVLVKWDDFVKAPETYIEQAYLKRDHEIARKVKVRP